MKRLVLRSALREARRLVREVPADLGVIGFDGQQLGARGTPALEPALDTRRIGSLTVEHVGRLLTGAVPLPRGTWRPAPNFGSPVRR
ncbi:hypothetical protein ACJ6WF_43420 [Streptomyces sp. MMS24-I2-30]|uniref:hypothetical protein n=1 Tax=Streptomyces sp. MMS24-I2-30 TaxID=3351564 RepID=UPI003896D035